MISSYVQPKALIWAPAYVFWISLVLSTPQLLFCRWIVSLSGMLPYFPTTQQSSSTDYNTEE